MHKKESNNAIIFVTYFLKKTLDIMLTLAYNKTIKQTRGANKMTTLNSKCGKYAVEFISDMVCAVFRDGQSYGGNSYWFTIGHYKTEKNAIKWAIKKMAQLNIELDI